MQFQRFTSLIGRRVGLGYLCLAVRESRVELQASFNTLRSAQVRRISWVRGFGRPGSGASGLLKPPLPAGHHRAKIS
jgi:hypothetical protein